MNTTIVGATACRQSLGHVWLLSLLAIWWLSAPFLNLVNHDGFLYAAIALGRLESETFARDPFFREQLQGGFSIYHWFLARSIDWFGVELGALVMAILGRLAWGLALVYFWRSLRRVSLDTIVMSVALALALLLPAYYSGYRMLSYGEAMAVPRNWAEAGVLLSLALHLRGMAAKAWLAWLLAAAFHPLMSLPALLVLVILQPARIRNVLLVLGTAFLLIVAAAKLGPFANLFVIYDDMWWRAVATRNYYVLPETWEPAWFVKQGMWAVLLVYIGFTAQTSELRRLARSLFLVMIVFLGIWLLGSQARNVLVVQWQLWRVMWLVQLLTPLLWAWSLPVFEKWQTREWTHCLLVLAAMLSGTSATTLLILPAIALMHPRLVEIWQVPAVRRWLPILAGILLVMTFPARLAVVSLYEFQHTQAQAAFPMLAAIAAEPVCTLPIITILFWLSWQNSVKWKHGFLYACTLAFSVTAISSTWLAVQRDITDEQEWQSLREFIPVGSVVQWDNGVDKVWLHLRRAHYGSDRQATGALFSRDLSTEMARRLGMLQSAGLEKSDKGFRLDPQWPEHWGRLERLKALCEDPQLDFIILNEVVDGADFRMPLKGVPGGEISVLKCRPS